MKILALYDSANAEQSETVRLARKGGPHPQVGSLYLLSVGIWLCPVDVPEGFPREAMGFVEFNRAIYEERFDNAFLAVLHRALLKLPDTYRVVVL